ncbi:MAG: dethiobiotin synthase [Myxococcota bacterium]
MPESPPRIFVVGTDTGVGKTAVVSALLHTARDRADLCIVPFKPAQSGDDSPSDTERLLTAAGLDHSELDAACPLRYGPPLAPGLADDPAPFLDPVFPNRTAVPPVVVTALAEWERRTGSTLTLIEGAGGLHVPMPGGTWLRSWITALTPYTLVVGRAGLGTINHTLATIHGLRELGRPPLGFMLNHTEASPDPSVSDNATVIATASGIPHLGTLPHGPEPTRADDLLDALLARLAAAGPPR